jgi:D-alanine-D-alanine ligase
MSRSQRDDYQSLTSVSAEKKMNEIKITAAERRSLKIALVFDEPERLPRSKDFEFPDFAEAEWETAETIRRIKESWQKLGFDVIELPIDKNFLARWSAGFNDFDLIHSLVEGWGTPSREAWIPALSELSGIPCIGSGPFGQCLAMRKSMFKILCLHLGIPTPSFHLIQREEDLDTVPEIFLNQPHFIKPDCEGSGMGIGTSSISNSAESTRLNCKSMLNDFPDGILLEELVDGIELTSAFVGNNPIRSLPIAQIEVDGGIYGLAHKGKDQMEEKVTFPDLPEQVTSLIINSMQILQIRAGLEDFTRFDWKLNASGLPMLLEANPLAGLSYYYSVLPKMAAAAGYSYEDFLLELANSALRRTKSRRFWYGKTRVQRTK